MNELTKEAGLTDAEVRADMRMLDEWAADSPDRIRSVCVKRYALPVSIEWECHLVAEETVRFSGPSPEDARHSAAQWLRHQRKSYIWDTCPQCRVGDCFNPRHQ